MSTDTNKMDYHSSDMSTSGSSYTATTSKASTNVSKNNEPVDRAARPSRPSRLCVLCRRRRLRTRRGRRIRTPYRVRRRPTRVPTLNSAIAKAMFQGLVENIFNQWRTRQYHLPKL